MNLHHSKYRIQPPLVPRSALFLPSNWHFTKSLSNLISKKPGLKEITGETLSLVDKEIPLPGRVYYDCHSR